MHKIVTALENREIWDKLCMKKSKSHFPIQILKQLNKEMSFTFHPEPQGQEHQIG